MTHKLLHWRSHWWTHRRCHGRRHWLLETLPILMLLIRRLDHGHIHVGRWRLAHTALCILWRHVAHLVHLHLLRFLHGLEHLHLLKFISIHASHSILVAFTQRFGCLFLHFLLGWIHVLLNLVLLHSFSPCVNSTFWVLCKLNIEK